MTFVGRELFAAAWLVKGTKYCGIRYQSADGNRTLSATNGKVAVQFHFDESPFSGLAVSDAVLNADEIWKLFRIRKWKAAYKLRPSLFVENGFQLACVSGLQIEVGSTKDSFPATFDQAMKLANDTEPPHAGSKSRVIGSDVLEPVAMISKLIGGYSFEIKTFGQGKVGGSMTYFDAHGKEKTCEIVFMLMG